MLSRVFIAPHWKVETPAIYLPTHRTSSSFYQLQHIMAAQDAADTVKDVVSNVAERVSGLTTSDNTPNLVLDEVTGESVSKSEFKKRQKQREKDAKKAERDATRQPPPQKKGKPANDAEDESQLNPNVSHAWGCALEKK
jgi:hypothetical protein